MSSARARPIAWLSALVAAGVALRLSAVGALAAPPLSSLTALADWADAREPAAAGLALVRAFAELTVWYLLAVSALRVLATGARWAGGLRLADALTIPALRHGVHAGLGLGLLAAAVPAPDLPGARDSSGSATMAPVAETPVVAGHATGTGTATMRPELTTSARPPGAPTGTARMAPAPTTWTVTSGESLWSIAEELLTDAWGRPVSDPDVVPVWQAIIERNRARLVDPADPDLILPGQVLELPPLPD